jgi:DNA polymerase-3 subunit epsilon
LSKTYAIIDIETTGGSAARSKITEIAIVLHDGQKVIDSYETLINPESPIPYNITRLTGISQEMVQDAPKFFEVAKKIVEMTEGAVFVAHNVRFDYSFVVEEFRKLGFTYTRKQLCTVRLSRKAFPGLRSYSLENLIKHFKIKVNDRHRAMADTMATVELFEKIMGIDQSVEEMSDMVNLGMKEALLPKNLSLEKIHALPEACGIYYMYDVFGDVVYIGKSINIKKRVAQHFSKKSEKASKLQQYVHDISCEITGSELVALLHESYEIKRVRPFINRAQKMRDFPVVIYSYEDENGFLCLDIEKPTAKRRKVLNVVAEFPSLKRAKGRMINVVRNYALCPIFCGLENSAGPCFDYHLKKCYGGCAGFESAEDYNERVEEAIERISIIFEDDFFLIDKGRTPGESTVILVEEGEYMGFGYADLDEISGGVEEMKDLIKPYPSNPEVKKIVMRFLNDNKGKGIKIIKI